MKILNTCFKYKLAIQNPCPFIWINKRTMQNRVKCFTDNVFIFLNKTAHSFELQNIKIENIKELATSNSVKQHLITVILNTKKPSKKLRWTYLRQIIFSWLYFLAKAIKDGSIIPPRSLRTRWSVDSAKIHREFK